MAQLFSLAIVSFLCFLHFHVVSALEQTQKPNTKSWHCSTAMAQYAHLVAHFSVLYSLTRLYFIRYLFLMELHSGKRGVAGCDGHEISLWGESFLKWGTHGHLVLARNESFHVASIGVGSVTHSVTLNSILRYVVRPAPWLQSDAKQINPQTVEGVNWEIFGGWAL